MLVAVISGAIIAIICLMIGYSTGKNKSEYKE